MIKGAIFDVDGTLLDSMYIWNTIGEKYLIDLGYEPEPNLNDKFKNMSLYQAACYYIKAYQLQKTPEEIIDEVNAKIEDYYRDIPLEKAGVKNLLDIFKKNHIKMCIASATDKYLIEMALKRLDMLEYFTDIFTCHDIGHGKDEPDVYEAAIRHLGLSIEEVVVFEDAAYALETASKMGLLKVGIYDHYEENQDRIKKLSDYYLKSYEQLEDLLLFLGMEGGGS